MRKQNSTFRTGFISEAGNELKNSDYFGCVELDEFACYVIADGISDMADGNSARLAIESVIIQFQEKPSISKRAIKGYLKCANQQLLKADSYKRLKASIVVVVTDYQKMRFAYAGNTRLRMYRNGAVMEYTRDMSLAQDMISAEEISKDALAKHEERNNLYSYLGHKDFRPCISRKIKLTDTDIIALYTRGIWEHVDEAELDDVLSETDNEVGTPLDNIEDMLLSRQPKQLGNYTLAVIFIDKVYIDPKRKRKIRRGIIIGVAILIVILILCLILFLLYRQKQKNMKEMNYCYSNTIEYINAENYVRAKEECEKALKLAEKLNHEEMRNRLNNYLLVIETVILADDSYGKEEYEKAQDYYLNAKDRARYSDNIGTKYMDEKLGNITAYLEVYDYLELGDTLLEKEDYAQAEEKYLLAKKKAASVHYDEGKNQAMSALENLYQKWQSAKDEQKEEANAKAAEEVSAAELMASGDAAFMKQDYNEAKLYYTMALEKYTQLEDTVNQEYINTKMEAVEAKISQQETRLQEASEYEEQGAALQSQGDYWSAKAQYLQAKNIYMELGLEDALERVEAQISALDNLLGGNSATIIL